MEIETILTIIGSEGKKRIIFISKKTRKGMKAYIKLAFNNRNTKTFEIDPFFFASANNKLSKRKEAYDRSVDNKSESFGVRPHHIRGQANIEHPKTGGLRYSQVRMDELITALKIHSFIHEIL